MPSHTSEQGDTVEIILCRHTLTDHNQKRIYSGQIDISLNQTGRRQADLLAAQISLLDGPSIGTILCSDLARAVYLGMAIGERVDVLPTFTEALREVHIGGMAGYVREEAEILFPDNQYRTSNPDFDFRDVGGESAEQVIDRHRTFLDRERPRLNEEGVERIVVVGHGTSLRLVFRDALKLIGHLHSQGEYQLVSW